MAQFILFPELMGSDQYKPLDGRWGIARIRQEVERHVGRLRRHLYPTLHKVQLCRGTIRNHTVVDEWSVSHPELDA